MLVNEDKTKVLDINFSASPLQRVSDLETVGCLNILGLIFNSNLNWSDHFAHVSSNVSKRLYILRVLKPILDHDQLILVFNSIIRSIIDYASPVFLNPGIVQSSKLEMLCKRAFRIIHGANVNTCDNCSMFHVCQRRKELSMRLFNQALNDSNHILHRLLPPLSQRSKRLILPHVKTMRRLNGFVLSCSMCYNNST